MALDERYITTTSLEVNFVENDSGLPLSGGFAEFYKDTDRVVPKPVYQLTGSPPNYTYTELSNPVFMSASGKFIPAVGSTNPIPIYAFPFDDAGDLELYYVVIKDSAGTIQEVREAWPNISTSTNPTGEGTGSLDNQVSNSQFVEVLFEPSFGSVISVTGAVSNQVYNIAPDWDLVISTTNSATVTVNRTAIAGSLNLPTNPPYTLDILTSGANISRLRLRQRLSHNPDIWANGFISGHFVISSQDGVNHTFELFYSPSIAPSATGIVIGTTETSGYQAYTATVALDPGTNTSNADTGYVDIFVELPTIGHFDITSIQVIGLDTNEQGVGYNQDTVNRQIDHLFNYYNPLIQYRAIESYLVGWYFPYNPAQLGDSLSMGPIGARKSVYLWDQTIGYQDIDDSWDVARGTLGEFKLTATKNTQFAIIQYIDQKVIRDLMSRPASVYAKMYKEVLTPDKVCTISLWYTDDAMLPDVSDGTNQSLVITLDSNGKPSTLSGNWTEITRSGLGDARLTVNSTSSLVQDEKYFTGFDLGDAAASQSATYGAIVVGFEGVDTGNIINITDISTVAGNTASPTPPKDEEQVLQECEFFYEKSYAPANISGDIVEQDKIIESMRISPLVATNINHNVDIFSRAFNIIYRNIKREIPVVLLYSSVTGAVGFVSTVCTIQNIIQVGIGLNPKDSDLTVHWDDTEIGVKEAIFYSTSGNGEGLMFFTPTTDLGTIDGYISFHYVADARLGIVL